MAVRKSVAAGDDLELSIIYVFDAPRELVFQHWLEPELMTGWFAPDGFSVTLCEIDAHPGGKWRVEYRSVNGEAHTEYGEFRELVAPEKLVFTLTQADTLGHVGEETMVFLQLVAKGAATEMHFRQSGFKTAKRRKANGEGWSECFRKLVGELGSASKATRAS
jgi:uncharacterized protein YndB with AHSA1/START domain